MDLSTMLAAWKAGTLKERPSKPLLSKLEKSHKAKVEKIRESPVKTSETKRLEENEARREFRSDWNRMRGEILVAMDEEIEIQRRAANPSLSEPVVSRMSSLAPVYIPRWERAAGNLVADAITFEQQGDEAGLRLARQHTGVLDPSQRSKATQAVDEALDAYKTSDQRKAESEVRSLGIARDKFELGSGMHQNFVRATTEPLRAQASAPSPMAGAVAPQR